MCARVLRPLFLLPVLLLLSSLAFSQDGGSPLPLPDWPESSEQSPEQLLSEPAPTTPDVQIDPRMTLEQRQAATLQAWIEYYKAVTIWQEQVKASWNKAKDSYEKADKARLKQIESRDIQIAALIEQVKQTRAAAFLSGVGGFVAGFITDRAIR